MTTELASRAGLPGTLTSNAYVLPADLSLEEWGGILRLTDHIVAASPWWLCDVMAYGEERFGETHSQQLPSPEEDPEGASQARMKQAGWMSRTYPHGTRVPGATYTHHRVAADLPPIERQALLREVAQAAKSEHPISTRALAGKVKARQEQLGGGAVTVDGDVICSADLVWTPTKDDLTDAARRALDGRLAGMPSRDRVRFEAGFLWALVWNDAEDAFLPGRYQG